MTDDEPVTRSGVTGSSGVRVRLDFGYDGTDFSGWAAQPGRRTVERTLGDAWATITGMPVRLTTAGRTDAGVHARGAVAHLDLPSDVWRRLSGRTRRESGEAAVVRLNAVLTQDVVVHRVREAPPGFDARFSALSRRYLYRICDRPSSLDPLRRRDTVVHRRELDLRRMNQASAMLLGLRDFAAFCRPRDGATTVRTLLEYSWRRASDGVLEATVSADAFCHSMVRFLVGAVVPVGEGRRDPGWPASVLASGLRDSAVTVVPPHGLSLEEVTYPADAEVAERAEWARSIRTL